jgi:hypothetical protein
LVQRTSRRNAGLLPVSPKITVETWKESTGPRKHVGLRNTQCRLCCGKVGIVLHRSVHQAFKLGRTEQAPPVSWKIAAGDKALGPSRGIASRNGLSRQRRRRVAAYIWCQRSFEIGTNRAAGHDGRRANGKNTAQPILVQPRSPRGQLRRVASSQISETAQRCATQRNHMTQRPCPRWLSAAQTTPSVPLLPATVQRGSLTIQPQWDEHWQTLAERRFFIAVRYLSSNFRRDVCANGIVSSNPR